MLISRLKFLWGTPCKRLLSKATAESIGTSLGLRKTVNLLSRTIDDSKAVTSTISRTNNPVAKVLSVPEPEFIKGLIKHSKYSKEEMDIALSMVDPKLAKRVKASGDLYTLSELYDMNNSIGKYSIDELLRYHGDFALLQAARSNTHLNSLGELKSILEEYVNNYSKFKARDSFNLAAQTQKINSGIRQFGENSPQRIIFRGELSESQIDRISNIYEVGKSTGQRLIYYPNHILSTSISKDAVTKQGKYAEKCLLEIEVPPDAKLLNVNKMLPAKNKFSWQEEFLLAGDSGFEILSRIIDGDRLVFRLRLLQ